MNGGVKSALLISGVALAGCSTANNAVEVRPIADRSAALANGDALAVARGQFMLGNVGLALEGFRKAQREKPNDPAVLSGIGDCYAAMGRFDIAESNYEVALSLAPRDHVLLMGLASILERGGDAKRAAGIRAEAARFAQTAALMAAQARARAVASAPPADPPRQVASTRASVTVALPPARPAKRSLARLQHVAARAGVPIAVAPAPKAVALSRSRTIEAAAVSARAPVPPPIPVRTVVEVPASAPPSVVPKPAAQPAISPIAIASEAAITALPALAAPELPAIASAVPLPLPAADAERRRSVSAPPIPVSIVEAKAEQHLALTAARVPLPFVAIGDDLASDASGTLPPVAPTPAPTASPAVALPVRIGERASPRLERLNRGEVALVTTGTMAWRPASPMRTAAVRAAPVRTAAADPVRWIPLPLSRAAPAVLVLNAARSSALAASARTVLVGRGWRGIGIGNATAMRRTSVVFYPRNRATLGRRLAAQFGVPARLSERNKVVLVLGRDSVGRIGGQRRS